MHVACVHRDIHAVTRGGICTIYRRLADELARRGHQVTLITQATPHPLPEHTELAGGGTIDVVTLPRTGISTTEMDGHRRAVTAAVQAAAPDIVECSTWEFELLDYVLTRPRVPVVVRGDLSAATFGLPTFAAGEEALVRHADALLAVSAFAAVDLATAYGVTPQVVVNGVDTTLYHPARATSRTISSGDLVDLDERGQITTRRPLVDALIEDPWLIGAAAGNHAPGPLRLIWIGKATKMKGWDRLEAIAPRLAGIAEVLIVLGHGQVHYPVVRAHRLPHVRVARDVADVDMPALYRAADWLWSTSRWEGFGLAIAEALACGTPVLLPTDLGVADELLAAGGGRTYTGADELLATLTGPRPGPTPTEAGGWLPPAMRWPTNTEITLAVYRRLLGAHKGRGDDGADHPGRADRLRHDP